MDFYDWVSGSGVFIGSCILSASLLSVRRKNVLPNQSLELNEVDRLLFGYERYSYSNSHFALGYPPCASSLNFVVILDFNRKSPDQLEKISHSLLFSPFLQRTSS